MNSLILSYVCQFKVRFNCVYTTSCLFRPHNNTLNIAFNILYDGNAAIPEFKDSSLMLRISRVIQHMARVDCI